MTIARKVQDKYGSIAGQTVESSSPTGITLTTLREEAERLSECVVRSF
jgi:hypothetical protein